MIGVAAILIACVWVTLAYVPVLVIEGMILAGRLKEPTRPMLIVSARMNARSALMGLLIFAIGVMMSPSFLRAGSVSPALFWNGLYLIVFCAIVSVEINFLNRQFRWERQQVFKACLAANLASALLFAVVFGTYAKIAQSGYTGGDGYIGDFELNQGTITL